MRFLTVNNLMKLQDDHIAVNNVSFSLSEHSKLAIAGQTGSGKSSLLRIIAGLLQPDSGNVFLEGNRVPGADELLIPGHPQIAYLSQYFELRNHYWVHELMDMVNEMNQDEAHEIFRICKIDHLLHRRTHALSGGERQRIVLAKLLITKPRLLLMDEPYSHLDQNNKRIIKSVINDLHEKMQLTCIMVTHDVEEILSWADHLLILKEGEIVQSANPKQVYFKPENEYVAALLGEYNLLDPHSFPHFNREGKNHFLNGKFFLRSSEIYFADANAVEGEILSSTFCGNYFSYQVRVGNEMLTITESAGLRKNGPILVAVRSF